MPDVIGQFEQAVLLALIRLGKGAYGRAILHEIQIRLKRNVSAGAVYATLEYGDGRKLAIEATQGELARLPLGQGERALFSLQPHPNVDIGLGPGQPARATEPIEGGALGLVIDARGRPLPFAAGRDERIAQAQAWRQALGIALNDEQSRTQGGVQ